MTARQLARDLLPPLLFRQLRKRLHLAHDIVWEGDFDTWAAAAARCTGYHDEAIVARVVASTRAVVSGEAVYERDSKLFDHVEYSWPLLASLLRVAAVRGSLRVLDFGGSLGTTLRQNARYLRGLPGGIAWRVVEQRSLVEAGRREFTDEVLSFHETIGDAAASGIDVALLAGVLNHVEHPDAVMRQIQDTGASHLILDRTMIVDAPRDVIAIQRVPASIYAASYPVRKFSRARLTRELLEGWRVIEQWSCDLQPDPSSTSIGLFGER